MTALVFKTVCLADIPAPQLFMFQLSGIVDAVLESVIAAVIFYLIDVHYRHVHERKLAGINIGYSVKALVIQYSNILKIIGVDEGPTWIDGAPHFGIDRNLIVQKCSVLNLTAARQSPLTQQPSTPKNDFETIINTRYKTHFAQINDNQFLRPHMDPKLIQLMTQLSFNVNMLVAHLNGPLPDGLLHCVTSIGNASRELLNYTRDDLFYSLGMAQEINGEDLFPPVNRIV